MSLKTFIRPGCTGMGSCARIAPAVFRMDADSGQPVVLLSDASEHRAAVLRAAESCPFIGVEEDGATRQEEVVEVTVARIQRLTPNIVELRLAHDGYQFTPGQYAFLRFREEAIDGIAGQEFFRPYSIAFADAVEVAFAIRVLTHGRAGRLISRLRPGDPLGLSRAVGRFTLRTADRPKLFLTGGTGIAPVLPMLRAAPRAAKTVVIGGRTEHDFIYLDEIRAIPNTELILVAHQHGELWRGRGGTVPQAIDELDLTCFEEFYTAGSPALVGAVRERLSRHGIPDQRIFCDSFEPGGPAAGSRSDGPAGAKRDWAGLLRRSHGMASLALATVFLFYAVTGFIANRSTWFAAEDTPAVQPAAQVVPSEIPLTVEATAPFLAGMLPPGSVPLGGRLVDGRIEASYARNEDRFHLRIDPATRAVSVEASRTLPDGLDLEAEHLLPWLRQRIGGEPDEKNIEDEDGTYTVDLESVWGTHQVTVDKIERVYRVATTSPPLVVSIVDLHRSKHAGAWQRIVIDVTALSLAGLVISGVAMGLLTRAKQRRRLAFVLLLSSFAFLTLLLLAR